MQYYNLSGKECKYKHAGLKIATIKLSIETALAAQMIFSPNDFKAPVLDAQREQQPSLKLEGLQLKQSD